MVDETSKSNKPKLNIKPIGLVIDEDLQLKQRVTQVNELAVSELLFNTGNAKRDKDLELMFGELEKQMQTSFEEKGGKNNIKNLFVSILDATKDITDHKVLPREAVMLMFQVGTTVSMDHTLAKDSKLSKDGMKEAAKAKLLDAELGDLDNILNGLESKVKANNATPATPAENKKPTSVDDDIYKDLLL